MNQKDGKTYWRSLSEWAQDPAVEAKLHHEFPSAPLDEVGTFGRRRFMQLMGASMALSSGAACRWEKENILAFTRQPAGHIPGVPKHYATSMELGGVASGLKVTSFDGRPIKVDGNPKHPFNRGGSSSFEQASVLELYDPDRSQYPTRKGEPGMASWDDFAIALAPVLDARRAEGGKGLAVLSEATSSPTSLRLRRQLQAKYPQLRWVTYEPLAYDNVRMGTYQAFGQQLRPQLHLKDARVIVSLDDELFCEHPAASAHGADFAVARKPEGDFMARLWAVESRHTTTGGAADHRLPLRSVQVRPFLLALMAEVLQKSPVAGAADLAALQKLERRGFMLRPEVSAFVSALAQDLVEHHGQSVISAGPGQSAEVHQLVAQLNAVLGNVGRGVTYVAEPDAERAPQLQALAELTADMKAGKIAGLFVIGGNPAFDAPCDLDFAAALQQVPFTARLGLFFDETSALCSWHLPRTHYLEGWGDGRAWDGTVSLAQPLLEPLYHTRTASQLLSLMLGEAKDDQQLVRATYADAHGLAGEALETHLRRSLHAGIVADSAWPEVVPTRRTLQVSPLTDACCSPEVDNGELEVTFWSDPHVYDGRFANNGWLQELPDFMAKLTWDNVAYVAPATAKKYGLRHEHLADLTVGERHLQVAVYVLPGQAEGSVALSLGYGRTHAGHVAGLQHGDVPSCGFNTYAVRASRAENFTGKLKLTDAGKAYTLAITQDHHSMDETGKKGTDQRVPQIVREADFAAYKEDPAFAKDVVEHPPLKSLWQEISYDGYKWGMAIDLNSCTGCGACVVACQAENNVPIVGKEQVINGREMHWLRIDRYFSGSPDAPKVVSQPMTCQQCELAPCESVCPVAATVHSHEGLNDMVYNRCIGTRYCSNNCPYKVRRFNFFNYHKSLEKTENQVTKMVYNPEVTVRARGVMEKCTYCVQRIQNVKIQARNHKRRVKDGEITTACAEACAADAIVFGDLNDANSRVARHHKSPRSYAVLEELNTKPRTQYLARVRNLHPALAEKGERSHKHTTPAGHPTPAPSHQET